MPFLVLQSFNHFAYKPVFELMAGFRMPALLKSPSIRYLTLEDNNLINRWEYLIDTEQTNVNFIHHLNTWNLRN